MPEIYYKILRKDLTHHGFKYKLGENIDVKTFQKNQNIQKVVYISQIMNICMNFFVLEL